MKELIQMEITSIRKSMQEAQERNDMETVQILATRVLQLQSRLHKINRDNWYRR